MIKTEELEKLEMQVSTMTPQTPLSIDAPIYDPVQAIEKVLALPDFTPVRFFAVLFPLWAADVSEVQEQGLPYTFIEKYVERAIAEAWFNTPRLIADFYGLDVHLVEKVVTSLETSGHLVYANGVVRLTPLGARSVSDGKKYVPQNGHRKLYCEGFYSRPLPRVHYQNVSLLSVEEATALAQSDNKGGYAFQRLYSFHPWNAQFVVELAWRPDKAAYNVPDEVVHLAPLSVDVAYLPLYIIEARKQFSQSDSYYVVCSNIPGLRDEYFESLVNAYPEILLPLHGQEKHNAYRLWEDWIKGLGLADVRPKQLANGLWQVALPADTLQAEEGKLSLDMLGTYHLENGYFLQIWCEDELVRCNAALDRTLQALKDREDAVTLEDVRAILQRFSTQLHTPELELTDLRVRAEETEMQALLPLFDEPIS